MMVFTVLSQTLRSTKFWARMLWSESIYIRKRIERPYYGPLTRTTTSGMPCRANMGLKSFTIEDDLFDVFSNEYVFTPEQAVP